jgi:hypothetical protein
VYLNRFARLHRLGEAGEPRVILMKELVAVDLKRDALTYQIARTFTAANLIADLGGPTGSLQTSCLPGMNHSLPSCSVSHTVGRAVCISFEGVLRGTDRERLGLTRALTFLLNGVCQFVRDHLSPHVNPHLTEIMPEARLEVGAGLRVQRLAGRTQNLVHDGWSGIRLRAPRRPALQGFLFLALGAVTRRTGRAG